MLRIAGNHRLCGYGRAFGNDEGFGNRLRMQCAVERYSEVGNGTERGLRRRVRWSQNKERVIVNDLSVMLIDEGKRDWNAQCQWARKGKRHPLIVSKRCAEDYQG